MTHPLRIVIVFAILSANSFLQGELITYQLVDGAAGDQAGHKLEGTITLDPSCASSCTSLHAWEYTISGPTLNRSVSSDDVGPLFLNPDGLFVATPTALTVNYDAAIGFTNFGGEHLLMDLAGLAWNIESPPGEQPMRQYFAYDSAVAGWDTTPPATTITIATAVPEPSIGCIALLLATFACLYSQFNKLADFRPRPSV